jgi:hypothetical protein
VRRAGGVYPGDNEATTPQRSVKKTVDLEYGELSEETPEVA